MDISPQSTKPISDDAELAKVLAGVSQHTDQALQFDTPPVVPVPAPSDEPTDAPADDTAAPTTPEEPSATEAPEAPAVTGPLESNPYETSPLPEPTIVTSAPVLAPISSNSDDLSNIKKDALNDLRPLVDKLDIAPEEKFDTYLLLIRSTDDKTLIEPAYAAAQSIVDESRKAQALLDVIKEIDYLSNPQK